MGTVILNGSDREDSAVDRVEGVLTRILEAMREPAVDFHLGEHNIAPCRSCGACAFTSPGECAFDDDMPQIIRAIANSELLVMLTPLRFGGYSSQLKKAVDKMMLMALPLYTAKGGHMLHPMRYAKPVALLGVGVAKDHLEGQKDAFESNVAANALNMRMRFGKALVFYPSDSVADMEQRIGEALREVWH